MQRNHQIERHPRASDFLPPGRYLGTYGLGCPTITSKWPKLPLPVFECGIGPALG